MQLTQAPVLVFPNWTAQDGVLVWPPDRNFMQDEPYELVESAAAHSSGLDLELNVIDRQSSHSIARIQCRFHPLTSECEFELLPSRTFSEVDHQVFEAIIENLKHSSEYIARLMLRWPKLSIRSAGPQLPEAFQL